MKKIKPSACVHGHVSGNPSGKLQKLTYLSNRKGMLLRSATALFMIWFSLLLIYGVTSNVLGEFYRFLFFVRNPIVMILNALTLLMALVHTYGWFSGGFRPEQCDQMTHSHWGKGVIGVGLAVIIAMLCAWFFLR